MDFSEFERKILDREHKGKHKVNNSWGVYDAYKHIRKNKWYNIGRPLKEHEFYTVIRKINNMVAKEISNGNSIKLPFKMGTLELRKVKVGAFIKNNKLEVTYPIDWKKTLLLWFENTEAYIKRLLVRREVPYIYKVFYNRLRADFQNKSFYKFSLNRTIRHMLKDNIEKGKIDTLW